MTADYSRTALNTLQDIVEVMCDPASKLSQRLHPFGMHGAYLRSFTRSYFCLHLCF